MKKAEIKRIKYEAQQKKLEEDALACCDFPELDIWWRRVECLNCMRKGRKASSDKVRIMFWNKSINEDPPFKQYV